MSKRIIVTAPIGDFPYLDETRPFILEYASRTGADYQEVKWFPESAAYGECNYFVAVEVIKRFSEQNYYDEMLFLDADVLVLPGSPNIFDLFTSMAMVDDWYIPNQDERFENWLRNNTGDLGVFDPKAAYFNSGVIGITRETAGKIDYSGPYPNMPWHDQDWLNYKIAKGKIEITQLDRAWNYRELGNPEQAIEDGHFLHFCGDMKKEIANFTQLLR